MSDLHIIVCMKVVPKSEEVQIDPETMTLLRNEARSEINPTDMNALESAFLLKDRHGGRVTLLAMGPPLFEDYLRVGLAMGADAAYLLSDRAFGAADTLATSYVLAAGAKKLSDYDLIICGEESADGATGQVPPGIAEWLDIAQVTYATALNLEEEPGHLRSRREVRGGHEVLSTPLPVLVSVVGHANEPRFMDMARRAWSAEEPVTIWGLGDLDVDPEWVGLPGSPTEVAGTSEAPKRDRRREIVAGAPEEQAQRLAAEIIPFLEAAGTRE
jgi:electron transfer flavoprotein beta subunit